MSNTIVIELCAEDRARLDRLAEALERKNCDSCVASALAWKENVQKDPIQQKLEEIAGKPTEAPKNATEEAKADTAPIDHPPEEELPWGENEATKAAKPPVTLDEIQQKVVQLAAANGGAKKAKVREIVNAYAKKVSDLPEDKWAEVWNKLVALESEG